MYVFFNFSRHIKFYKPARLCNDHLGSQGVELVPQMAPLQCHACVLCKFNIFNTFLIYSMIYVPQVTTPQCHAFVLHSVQLRSKYAQKMRAPNNSLQSSIHARKCTKRSVWQSICLLFIVFLYSDLTDVSIQKSVLYGFDSIESRF